MNLESSDARTEVLVRELLAARRPTGPARDELRDRIAEIPSRTTTRVIGRLTAAASLRPTLAGLATAAVLAVIFASGAIVRLAIGQVGAPVLPPTTALDPELEGMGIVRAVQPAVPFVVALLTVFILAAIGLAISGRGRLGLLAIAGLIAAVSLWVGNHAPPVFGFGAAPRLGLDLRAEPPPGSNGPSVYYVTAAPGEPFVALVSIHNPGPLPIRLHGLVDDPPIDGPPDSTHWTSLWLQLDGAQGAMTDEATPFAPIEIPPDGYMGLFVVGRAGSCAFGPSLTMNDVENAGMVIFDHLRLAYSVLGWPAQTDLELPFRVAVPGGTGDSGCAN